jgi:raffinose/stachyose/melibiose transport system permease protein
MGEQNVKKKKKTSEWTQNDKIFLGVLIPILILFFCFNTLPLLKGFYYGLTNFKGYGDYDFVGLRNFAQIFQDSRVGKSYLFTFKYAIVMTILVNVISLILALGLNSNIKGKNALRGIYFVPNILGGLVVGYIFSFIFTYILPAIGQATGIKWMQSSMLASTKLAWVAIVIVGVWQSVAMNTIIYISGLQTVPEDVYEACMLDGASGWKKFTQITFPLIMPFFTINLVLCMKNSLMVFDQVVALTQGGPAQSTESISYLIYNNGMSGGQFGFQSANAFLFFVVIVVISFLQMKFLGEKEEQL